MLCSMQAKIPEAVQVLLRPVGEIAVVILIAGCLYYCLRLLRRRQRDETKQPITRRRKWIYTGVCLCLLAALPFYCRWRCAWLYLDRGNQAVQIRRWEAARHFYQAALRYKPDWPPARARLLFVESEPVTSLDDVGWSLSPGDKPTHPTLRIPQADRNVESWRRRANLLQKAIALDVSWAPSRLALGVAFYRIGERQKAESEFRTAVRCTPNDPLAHRLLASCLGSRGALDESIFQYREAVRCQPDNARSHYSLSTALLSKGDRQGKAEMLQAVGCLSRHAGDFSTSFKIGCGLQGLSCLTESREAYRIALQSAGSPVEKAKVLLLFASVSYELRDVEEAKKHWQSLLAFQDVTLASAAIELFGPGVSKPWEGTMRRISEKYYGEFNTHPRKWAKAGALLCEAELAAARQCGRLPTLSADPFRVYKVTGDGGIESYEGGRPGSPGGRFTQSADGKLGAIPPRRTARERGPIVAINDTKAGGLFTLPRDEAGEMPWVPEYHWAPTIIFTNKTAWHLRAILVRPIGVASPSCFPLGAGRHIPWPVQGYIETSLKPGAEQTIRLPILGGHYLNAVSPAVNDAGVLPLVEMVRIVGQPGVDFINTSTHLTYYTKQFIPGKKAPPSSGKKDVK